MSYSEKKRQIDELQQRIASFGNLPPEIQKKINYKFRLDWNYYSNSMEGNTLTMDETRSVMVGNITVGGKPIKDVLEIKGHDEIISQILAIGKGKIRLSEKRIKAIHKGIMHEEEKAKGKEIGQWKKEANYLYNYKGERFEFAHPAEVPEKMHTLLNKTNSEIDAVLQTKKEQLHPLDIALQFHLDFVVIHPFYDGNGRVARILTNLLLVSLGYPPFWVKSNEREMYSQYLGDIQGYGGSPDLFFEFGADMVLRSQRLILDAIAKKDISSTDDFDKEIKILKRMQQVPEVKIEKSTAVMNIALEEVLFPLLLELNSSLSKLASLFKSANWSYFEEPKPTQFSNPIGPVFGTIQESISYHKWVFKTKEESSHHFKTSYWLENYNDQNGFSVEVALKITFRETGYEIAIYIGEPLLGGRMIKLLNNAIEQMTEESPFEPFKEYVLYSSDYDGRSKEIDIGHFAKQISNEALAYIKLKANI